jgi:hypothetical protein
MDLIKVIAGVVGSAVPDDVAHAGEHAFRAGRKGTNEKSGVATHKYRVSG